MYEIDKRIIVITVVAIGALAGMQLLFVPPAVAQSAQPRFLDRALPAGTRAADLVSRLTLEEKASQMVNQSRAIPRLGVPAYDWWNEALHGVVTDGITEFPAPVGLAATFDSASVQRMAHAIGIEGRIKHARAVKEGHSNMLEGLDFWAPNLNIFRDPRWGRGQETYGEDPFLSGRMGVAYVKGMQGDDPRYYLAISTPKHYAVHSGPEPSRHRDDVAVSKHDELDTYLPAFRAAVTEGKAGSVMCAYNAINGEPACANRFLLEDQLRGKWGFQGYVVSDCDAVGNVTRDHHYVKTLPEAAAIVVQRGMDNECNSYQKIADDHDYRQYIDAVKQGFLKESEMDRSLVRLFTARIRLGMFDPPQMGPYSKIDEKELDSAEHRALARKIADESMVLLKNDGVLPIPKQGRKILVAGPLAEQTKVLLGNYNGHPTRSVSILDGMYAEFGRENVRFAPGTTYLERRTDPVPAEAFHAGGQSGLRVTYEYAAEPAADGKPPEPIAVDGGIAATASAEKMPDRKDGPKGKLISIEWAGKINVSETGYYNIGIESQGEGSVFLDGKYVAGTPGWDATAERLGRLYFEAGKPVDLKVSYEPPDNGKMHAELVWIKPEPQRLAQAVGAAKNSDVVVAVVGITSELEGEEMQVDEPGFKGGDRTSIDLPKPEQELVEALAAAGKPLVLVLTNGSALAINRESKLANAVLDAFYPGEEGGAAVAETLSGSNNPAGRLPITFYTGLDQVPPFSDYAMKGRTYRYFTGKPLFPFGFGLSYTTFKYGGLKLSARTIQAGDPLSAEVSVTNTGKLAGDEVAELYLKFPPLDGAPLLALRGFQRIHLQPGETRAVAFHLDPRALSMVSAVGDPTIAEGQYTLFVGGAQPGDTQADDSVEFNIQGTVKIPE
ncbi:MAG: glycoside hydrolase family 3 C-terminal domain-containing protein [Terriglobia bacterium]